MMLEKDHIEQEPNEIMKEAIDQGLTHFYVGYSGGKDSGICLDLIAKNYPKYFKGVLFINTGIGTQETLDFVKEWCKQKNYPLFIVRPEDVKRVKEGKYGKSGDCFSYSALVNSKGFPKAGLHTTTMRVLKYFPMRKFIYDRLRLGEKPCIVSGVRKNESARRKIKWNSYLYNDGKMWFVSPLFFKSNDWVYKYFIENDIKRSPVYETLHISGDCLCGCFAQKGELKLLEMFHPEVFKKIKDLENQIKIKGTKEAKKHSTWGNGGNTKSIESQTTIESFVCTDCILDRSSTDKDTKRFNKEFDDIDKKLKELED
jgi:3'-phosphoadenosine 5'-phosphosulfate sulfotransferase (PAPS reductase)/FAD synthetase